ncbi:hypothetical protein WMF28_30270 [Sorangium sp. So ce590]|uniref:hypothetical protein n=1 Tax=Sorangium sp. So ce590 TaxID=3133317 RepID=UPI003F6356D8
MTAQVQYDPQIIQQFAASLYRQANSIVATYALLFGLLGTAVGAPAGAFLLGNRSSWEIFAAVGAVVLGGFVGLLGALMGQQRAFALKLQAQQALCQLQIEANTRATAAYARSS